MRWARAGNRNNIYSNLRATTTVSVAPPPHARVPDRCAPDTYCRDSPNLAVSICRELALWISIWPSLCIYLSVSHPLILSLPSLSLSLSLSHTLSRSRSRTNSHSRALSLSFCLALYRTLSRALSVALALARSVCLCSLCRSGSHAGTYHLQQLS